MLDVTIQTILIYLVELVDFLILSMKILTYMINVKVCFFVTLLLLFYNR